MRDTLGKQIEAAVQAAFDVKVEVELTRPEEEFGDYATNVALQLAGQLGKKPRDIAETLAKELGEKLAGQVSEVAVAGPGFLNFRLNDQTLLEALDGQPSQTRAGQEILVEFGDPNPFKAMHLGHLYSTIVGDVISRLLESAGADVKRLSYHGDVGMHVAKAIWGIRELQKEQGKDINSVPRDERPDFLSTAYATGAQKYEEDATAKQEIEAINERVYKQDDPDINNLYQLGKEWSFEYFDKIFDELGVHYKKRYLESDSSKEGLEFVKAHVGKVFEKSDGAIIYKGEKAGLHTRVFINSRGLPTYEAKDLGLAELKNRDFPEATESVIITAHEQSEYFKVMLAALREIDSGLADKTKHIAHGFLSLTTGKMSSRRGDVYAAADLLAAVQDAIKRQYPESTEQVQTDAYLAGVKYTFLKNRIGGDIVFDVQESVTLEGNSGPYLQYAHARARSILKKAGEPTQPAGDLQPDERSLARKISEYPEVVDKAVSELMPHHVCTYLYELAQVFNHFYEGNRVIGDERQALRLGLVNKYAETLQRGLSLLGIAAPERM